MQPVAVSQRVRFFVHILKIGPSSRVSAFNGQETAVGIKQVTPWQGATTAIHRSPRRQRVRAVAILLASALIGTLGACSSPEESATEPTADATGPANVWPLTGPEASTGGVALSLKEGAQWSDDGLTVDGTGYASTSTPGPIATDSSFTVSAWVRPTGQPGEYASIISQSGDVAGAFFLGIAEGFWSFSVKPDDGNGDDFVTNRDRATQGEVVPDAWVHLAGIYDADGGKARFFLNGYPVSEQGVATDPVFAAQGPILIGAGQAHRQLADFFEGTISDARTWPRALSAEEVTAAAQAQAPPGATLDQPEQSASSACPDPHGGLCLGTLTAGTYSTQSFSPALTYTVPEGWTNREDLPGNFLLSRVEDPDEGPWGGSYIGVYQNVRAPALCSEEAQPGVGTSAADLTAWYRTVPGLEIVAEAPVTMGGLSGTALDFRVSDDWKSQCPLDGVIHAVPIIIGGGTSDLHHVMGAPLEMRLILLDWKDGNVAIEVTSVRAQQNLTDYLGKASASTIIDTFTFGT